MAVTVTDVIKKYSLRSLTPEIDTDRIRINHSDINRPALQLAGYFDHFGKERVQIIGLVEYTYIETMGREFKLKVFETLFASEIPCLIYCRSLEPDEDIVELAHRYGVSVLVSDMITSDFMGEIIRWLKTQLAPMITIHGVLVEVFGEGVLIMGESGIGKSEAALELIKRGHRLVTDDVVELRKVSDDTLVGSAPDITRHLIELRGIGIVDVKGLFGVAAVKNTQSVDMVIKLEEWSRDKEYDRLGLDDQYIEFLGNKVVCYNIPIRPGRNLAVIVESAAVNSRQKKMGYNAAQELYKKVQRSLELSEIE
ncbi:MAG: HPr(Ser) kinase/phosphatase [Lachnospiraceae bacterium]|jgi:HPr kinase/phosphorylase|nr:HPr(Ser) kinase/phosphatase [Lachnospiraceae bacterium]